MVDKLLVEIFYALCCYIAILAFFFGLMPVLAAFVGHGIDRFLRREK